MEIERLSRNKSFGGYQDVYRHYSEECACNMTFAVYVPPHGKGEKLPVLWYLSGLTCSHVNVMEKGEYRRFASEYGLIVVCPDTSPRGNEVADEEDNWQFGKGAGFYVDASEMPYAKNYRMYSYVVGELPKILAAHFPVDMSREGVMGHSMGGHGALVMALREGDERYKSCSAFAPIVSPSSADWSIPAFEKYLGKDTSAWRSWDACSLIEDGHRFSAMFIDQGKDDAFLGSGLRPELLEAACKASNIPLRLRMQDGYDHSYYFISTFIEDHMAWHGGMLSGL